MVKPHQWIINESKCWLEVIKTLIKSEKRYKMKLSSTVIALAAVATNAKGADKQSCEAHFASDGHSSTINVESADNLSGSIDIDNYSDNTNCFVNVVTNPICSSITAKIVHAGFESSTSCRADSFKFIDSNGVESLDLGPKSLRLSQEIEDNDERFFKFIMDYIHTRLTLPSIVFALQ